MTRFKGFDNAEALSALGLVLVLGTGMAQAQPRIDHGGIQCLPDDRFTLLYAVIDPAAQVRTAKLYFRSAIFADYYYVEMAPSEGYYSAALPLPGEQTTRILYYLEAVDYTFNTTRTLEFEVEVGSGDRCRPGPAGALFQGTDPGIAVGVTRVGMPAIPVGFQAIGIRSLIAATGGGASSLGLAVGAVAGAGAGVGVLVATGEGKGGNPDPDEGERPPGVTTTVSQAPGPSTPGPTTSSPGSNPPGVTTTSVLGGPGPDPIPPAPVPEPEPEPGPVTACFTWEPLGNCEMRFTSCSTPEPRSALVHEWRMLGPATIDEPGNTPVIEFDFAGDPRCDGGSSFNRPVRLTVSKDGMSAQVQESVSVNPAPSLRASSRLIQIQSQIIVPAENVSARGELVVNGESMGTSDQRAPILHRVRARSGENRLLAYVPGPPLTGSLWRFDFAEPVEFAVRSGTPFSVTDRTIVFLLGTRSGERIELSFRLVE